MGNAKSETVLDLVEAFADAKDGSTFGELLEYAIIEVEANPALLRLSTDY